MSLQVFLLVLNPYKNLHFQLHCTINTLASSWLGLMKYSMVGPRRPNCTLDPEQKDNCSMATENTANPSQAPGHGCGMTSLKKSTTPGAKTTNSCPTDEWGARFL